MSMTRRAVLLWLVAMLPLLLGGWVLHVAALRDTLSTQWQTRNQDAARGLAAALAAQPRDNTQLAAILAVQFDLGLYQRLSLGASGQSALFERRRSDPPLDTPRWFVAAWPLSAPAGTAAVDRAAGQAALVLRVETVGRWAEDLLWASSTQAAALLIAVAAAAAALAGAALRGWRRQLRASVAQAQAISQGRLALADESDLPDVPEVRELMQAMNGMIRRLREGQEAQAAQVAALQRQAQADDVTGLPRRGQFIASLDALLGPAPAPARALLLVRLMQIDGLNERLGFDATDRLLAAAAELLQAYVDRVPGAFAARLNGCDFGLALPVAGVAVETADSLAAALSTSPLVRAGAAQFCIGGVDQLDQLDAGAALAAADAALARAEFTASPVVDGPADAVLSGFGARAWRQQIADALDAGRVQLAEVPVVDREGRLIHLECTLCVQFDAAGDFRPARQWLALAMRSRLTPRVDLAGLRLALAASATDGRPRCVLVAQDSLLTPGFVAEVVACLAGDATAARQVAFEWLASPRPPALSMQIDAAASWRGAGARLGAEHAGAPAQALARWQSVGIDHIKFDARHFRGLADDPAVQAYAAGLLALVRQLGLRALAGGVDDQRDLAALWGLGFDGAAGAAVRWGRSG